MNPFPPPLPSGPWHPWQYCRKIACPCFESPTASAAGAMIGSKVKATRTRKQGHIDLKRSSLLTEPFLSPSQTDFHALVRQKVPAFSGNSIEYVRQNQILDRGRSDRLVRD